MVGAAAVELALGKGASVALKALRGTQFGTTLIADATKIAGELKQTVGKIPIPTGKILIPVSDGFPLAMPTVETKKLEELLVNLESRAKQVLSGGKKAEELSGVLTGSFFGKTEQQIKRHLPKDWHIEPARGNGWVAKDANNVERIRFMRPANDTTIKFDRMKQGYWRRLDADGVTYLDEYGSKVPSSLKGIDLEKYQELTHIPYTGVRR